MTRALAALALLLLAGCAVQHKDYGPFFAHAPRSILVVPVLNETTELEASGVVAATVSEPIAERGYYVFPVYLTEALLRDLGLSEAGHVHELPPQKLFELFGADAVLYATVTDWGTKYLVIDAATVVEIDLLLRDTRTGTVLWEATGAASQNAGGQGDPIAQLIAAAIFYVMSETMEPDYRPLASRAAALAVAQPGSGLPAGPYSPQFGADRDQYGAGQ